jgi:serine/threonine protein kinase
LPLSAGTRLGPYEILEAVGEGGMGEVYRARDTRLDRTVALKVVRSGLTANPEFRQRFHREARAISGLSHPNICTLHDVGRDADVDFLVMEYLEGEPLSRRLAKGPLPLDVAMRCATQIAEALDQAHSRGIVHRDLKPANVMLTRGGTARGTTPDAKLLDFGLAKAAQTSPSQTGGLSATATAPHDVTSAGTIVGTVHYMAPEQLEGKPADARSDIFAFGAMLYEMVTGRRAFDGATPAAVIGAILTAEPAPLRRLRPDTPPALEYVVGVCLSKDADARWASARDLVLLLRGIQSGPLNSAASAGVRTGGNGCRGALPPRRSCWREWPAPADCCARSVRRTRSVVSTLHRRLARRSSAAPRHKSRRMENASPS